GAGNILGAEQSGFISEIGYEMYHRILKEAVDELKKEEFSDVFKDTKIEKQQITRECQIETDLELLLPQSYVESTTERLNLYRELDAIDTEVQLTKFIEKIIDRFGALPQQTIDLIDAIRLRWLAGALGFEKVVLRNNRLSCYFPENQNDIYFQSDAFIRVIDFVKQHPKTCLLKEKNNMLRLIFPSVKQISDAISSLTNI
ncbi:MAG: TRCF domain-containing protein, partial [Bacteroidales bacterium]|nr:TRCF domain-containing protein [Bacteroidales bacterium]